MTQDYSECKHYVEDCTCRIEIFTKRYCDSIYCKDNPNCYFKQNKRNEHQLKLINQDNDALSRYCEMLEKKIAQLANMQDKKVILE